MIDLLRRYSSTCSSVCATVSSAIFPGRSGTPNSFARLTSRSMISSFKPLGHPHQPEQAVFRAQEFPAGDVKFGMPHKARIDVAASHHACQRAEFHAHRGHFLEIAVHGHEPLASRAATLRCIQSTRNWSWACGGCRKRQSIQPRRGWLFSRIRSRPPIGHRAASMTLPLVTGWLGPVGLISKLALQSSQL